MTRIRRSTVDGPLWSSPRAVRTAVVVLCVALSAGLLWRLETGRMAAERDQAALLAQGRAQVLQRNVERMVSNNYALAAMVRQGGGTIDNFEAAVGQLLLINPRLQALSIAPTGVVSNVVPRKGNERLIGFDQFGEPAQRKEAVFTRDTGHLTLAGPFALAQGGMGVVSRLPVYLDDALGVPRFWGFTNVTLRMDDLMDGVALSDIGARGYAYELWRLQIDSGTKQVIASASPAALVQPVRQSLAVPNGAWNLDIAPTDGWVDLQRIALDSSIALLASLLLGQLAGLLAAQRRYKASLESQVVQRTAEILAAQNHLKSTLDAIRDPMFELSLDGCYHGYNTGIDGFLPESVGDLTGKTVFEVLPAAAAEVIMQALRSAHENGHAQGQQFALRLSRGLRWFELSVTGKAVDAGADARFVVMLRDITERKTAEQEIRRLAFYDPLTALPNRRLLQDRLEHAQSSAARSHHHGALLLIDLDNFKALNDTVGHDKGDLLLLQVAQRLASCVRESDTVARLGGDEFVVMIDDLAAVASEAAAHAQTVAEKIVHVLSQPYDIAGHEHRSSSSIGVSLFGAQTGTWEDILKRSDVAMYQAKAAGRNTLRFFDPEMQVAVDARATLERDVRLGLLNHEFSLHYQPQVGPDDRVFGAEALLRWSHPVRGAVSPGEFIPVAEQSGLMLQIGRWVLETACKQLAQWAGQPLAAGLTLAVNVSVQQFRQPDFVDQVRSALSGSGALAHRLKLEMTESVFAGDLKDIIDKMNALKSQGVGFSLDDFGTGYSSLSYLKRLPLDQLKIDQSFVHDVLNDPNDAAIVRTIVALGRSLGLDVIAEGVENQGQRDFLAEHGCGSCQGYLISRALAVAEFDVFLLEARHAPLQRSDQTA